MGVVLATDGPWQSNSRTVTFVAALGYVLEDSGTYQFTDAGRCETEPPIPPVHKELCGVDNDVVELDANQPENIIYTSDGEWTDGTWNISFSAEETYKLPDGTTAVYNLVDSGPCVTDLPLAPVVTQVCGPNNDVVQLADNQPANVLVTSDGAWSDGKWNITFSAAENHVLPLDATAVYNLVDENDPCPTDAPVPPVQSAICGPDNDLLTFPDQPEGVTLDTDSDWKENERTVTFAISDEFITDGPTSFTFKDANEACPVISVGKTVTVKLETSDGGSIEGATWVLDASVASQVGQPAYDSGVVDANNTIVFEELMAGQYRLTVDAEGYEPVDEVLTIIDDGEAQELTIRVTALHVPATPTPEPTAAPVSALPSTGSGSDGGSVLAGLALVISAVMMAGGLLVSRRQRIPHW